MKTKLFVLIIPALLMFGSVAHAQMTGVYDNTFTVTEHAEHASTHSMGTEQSLFGGGGSTYAQGERPLWEFGHPVEPKPLGDVAREFRQQKLTAKKAEIVFEKDGSTDDKAR
jgi:hypothetical protein